MVTQTYDLDLVPGGTPLRVRVSQYDSGSRTLAFRLHAAGTEFPVPSSASVRFTGTRPDGMGFSKTVQFSGTLASLPVDSVMTALPGVCRCQLTVTEGGNPLGSGAILLQVEPAALTEDTQVLPAADVTVPEAMGLTGTQAAILPLEELGQALAFGADPVPCTDQALERFSQAAKLLELGVPVYTPVVLNTDRLLMVSDISDTAIRYAPVASEGVLMQPVITLSATAGVQAVYTPLSGTGADTYVLDLDKTSFDPTLSEAQSLRLQETLDDGTIVIPPTGLMAALTGGGRIVLRYTSGSYVYSIPSETVQARPSISRYQVWFPTRECTWYLNVTGTASTIRKETEAA